MSVVPNAQQLCWAMLEGMAWHANHQIDYNSFSD